MINRKFDGGNNLDESLNPLPIGTMAVQLGAVSEDEVSSKVLWQDGTGRYQECPIAHNGLVYSLNKSVLRIRDIMTGAKIDERSCPSRSGTLHMHILAGHQIIGLTQRGISMVASLSNEGRKISGVAVNHLGNLPENDTEKTNPFDYMFNYGCQLFASGNRIFIRSMRDLYCLGDPAQPLRLSPEHQ